MQHKTNAVFWCFAAHIAIFLGTHIRLQQSIQTHTCKVDLRGESINHVCIFNEYQIQPTTSPLPACGHAHLLPPSLKKLPDILKTDSQMKFITAGYRWQCSKTSSGWCCWKTKLLIVTSCCILYISRHNTMFWPCRKGEYHMKVKEGRFDDWHDLKDFHVFMSCLHIDGWYKLLCVCALTLLCSEGKAPMPTLVVYALTTP